MRTLFSGSPFRKSENSVTDSPATSNITPASNITPTITSNIISLVILTITSIISDLEEYILYAMMLAFIIGGAIAGVVGFDIEMLWLLAIICLAIIAVSLFTRRPALLILVVMMLGFAWHGITTLQQENFGGKADEAVFFEGRVVEIIESTDNYFVQLAEQESEGYTFVMRGTDSNGWHGKLMIVSSPVKPRINDRLSITGIVYEFTETYNFNLLPNNYLRNNNIAAVIRPVPDGITFLRLAGVSPYSIAESVRNKVFSDMSALPEIQQALLKGMAFGETNMLSGRQSTVLQQTGIMHIFAVSGLHIGYIMLLGLTVLRFVRRTFGLPRWTVYCGTALLVLFFSFVVGFSPSVLRATIMAVIALMCQAISWEHRGSLALVWAAFVLLLIEPLWIFQPGFLLSFAAAAGIVFGTKFFHQLIPQRFALSRPLAASVTAQMMTMPILAYFFSTVSIIGLLLSPLVVMMSGFVIIFALLAMLLSFVNLAYIPLVGAGLVTEFIYNITELFAALPNAFTYAVRPSALALLIYYCLMYLAYKCIAQADQIAFDDEMDILFHHKSDPRVAEAVKKLIAASQNGDEFLEGYFRDLRQAKLNDENRDGEEVPENDREQDPESEHPE